MGFRYLLSYYVKSATATKIRDRTKAGTNPVKIAPATEPMTPPITANNAIFLSMFFLCV